MIIEAMAIATIVINVLGTVALLGVYMVLVVHRKRRTIL